MRAESPSACASRSARNSGVGRPAYVSSNSDSSARYPASSLAAVHARSRSSRAGSASRERSGPRRRRIARAHRAGRAWVPRKRAASLSSRSPPRGAHECAHALAVLEAVGALDPRRHVHPRRPRLPDRLRDVPGGQPAADEQFAGMDRARLRCERPGEVLPRSPGRCRRAARARRRASPRSTARRPPAAPRREEARPAPRATRREAAPPASRPRARCAPLPRAACSGTRRPEGPAPAARRGSLLLPRRSPGGGWTRRRSPRSRRRPRRRRGARRPRCARRRA